MIEREAKKTSKPTKEMISSFEYLKDTKKKLMLGGIICLNDMLIKIDENNYSIPVSSIINLNKN